MPIRLRHTGAPGAIAQAGVAIGFGRARQRQQKYALDLLRRQQDYLQQWRMHMAPFLLRDIQEQQQRLAGGE